MNPPCGTNTMMRAGVPGEWKTSTGPVAVPTKSSIGVNVVPPSVEWWRPPGPHAHSSFGTRGSTTRPVYPPPTFCVRACHVIPASEVAYTLSMEPLPRSIPR